MIFEYYHLKAMSSDDALQGALEAALYAAGRPLSLEELMKAAGVSSKRRVLRGIESLMKAFSQLKALEIVELPGEKFVMQLKPKFNRIARRFAIKPLLSPSVLKTLSFIVYFQPITAKELAERRGPHIYEHLRLLEELGFVECKPSGKTKLCRTTPTFADYFGLSPDPQAMKQQLAKMGRLKALSQERKE